MLPTVSATMEFCLKSNKLMIKLELVQLIVIDGFLNSNTIFNWLKLAKVVSLNLTIRILLTMLMLVAVYKVLPK